MRGNPDRIYIDFRPLGVYCKFAGVLALRHISHQPPGVDFSWMSPEAVWPFVVALAPKIADLLSQPGDAHTFTRLSASFFSMAVGFVQTVCWVRASPSIVRLMERIREMDRVTGGLEESRRRTSYRWAWPLAAGLLAVSVTSLHALTEAKGRSPLLSIVLSAKFLLTPLQFTVFAYFCDEVRWRIKTLRSAWTSALRSGNSQRIEEVRCWTALAEGIVAEMGEDFGSPLMSSQLSVLSFFISTVRRFTQDTATRSFTIGRSFDLVLLGAGVLSTYASADRCSRCVLYFQHQLLMPGNHITYCGQNVDIPRFSTESTMFIMYIIAALEMGPMIQAFVKYLNKQYKFSFLQIPKFFTY